jgi:hypothetical protein
MAAAAVDGAERHIATLLESLPAVQALAEIAVLQQLIGV